VSKLGKSAIKLATTYAKGTAKCLANDISGKAPGSCPDSKTNDKTAKIAAKVVSSAEKSCFSTCSTLADYECVTDLGCPPPFGTCSAGVKGILFDIANINFPGPYCSSVGVPTVSSKTDIGTCTSGLASQSGVDLVATIYGSITSASSISPGAAACLAKISKPAQKLTATTAKAILKCRDSINKGKLVTDTSPECEADPEVCVDPVPSDCDTDAKTAAKIDKANTKLVDAIAGNCDDAQILELDICGNGVGGTATVAEAQACLSAAAKEIANSNELPTARTATEVTIIESAMPPPFTPALEAALFFCGNNIVDGTRNDAQPLGEECDGTDDSECPGLCLPPGDLFQCTCGDRTRWRFEADASITDSDAGWVGPAMDQKVGDRSGFTLTLINCDCDEFTGATCTGTSVDPVCDAVGAQRPVCDWRPAAGPHCEGDVATENDVCASNADCGGGTCVATPSCDATSLSPDGEDTDEDCAICDASASNAGSPCDDDTDCNAQCFPIAGGAATTGCTSQANCAAGEVCLGRCDPAPKCSKVRDGSPFPVVASSFAVCSQTVYRDNIVGTLNIVTGEHTVTTSSFSVQHIGESLFRPCPVCGGKCNDGLDLNRPCTGRCRNEGGTGSLDSCRFESDCVAVDESCSTTTPDCRDSTCNLEPVCLGNPETESVANGNSCDIFFVDPLFGALSTECPADPGTNITGQGFPIDYMPGSTTEPVVWPATEPCSASGFELYDCHCPGAGGQPSKPNNCNTTCDAGVNALRACGGGGTTCSAGTNAGAACDEDADCPGGACDDNPLACTGDSGTCFASGDPCDVDSDCPLQGERCSSTNGQPCGGGCGSGVCGDACPGGRCVPLCTPRPGDLDDGVCSVDSRTDYNHCTGLPGLGCQLAAVNAALLGDCSATCSVSGTPCGSITECPVGETCDGPCPARQNCEAGADGIMGTSDDFLGGGECRRFPTNCHPDPVMVEGGTTLNGEGDSTDVFHVGVWCFIGTQSGAVNASSGFPGPGVIERKGTGFVSTPSIP
jgi:hypothetical protein